MKERSWRLGGEGTMGLFRKIFGREGKGVGGGERLEEWRGVRLLLILIFWWLFLFVWKRKGEDCFLLVASNGC